MYRKILNMNIKKQTNNSQLEKRKEETMYYDIVKRKKKIYIYIYITIHKKLQLKSKEVEGEEKKKLNSKGVSNSICNLVTYGMEREQFKIYIKKLNQWVLNAKGGK